METDSTGIKQEPPAPDERCGADPLLVHIKKEKDEDSVPPSRRKRSREPDGPAPGRVELELKKEKTEERESSAPAEEETEDGAKPSPPKKPRKTFIKRQRTIGDEEQKEIDNIGADIDRIEKEIKDDASSYEECRRILSLGVTSLMAMEQTQKMDALMQELKRLKEERQKAINKKDSHLVMFLQGDDKAVLTEEVRDERAIRAKYHPMSKEPRTETAEIDRRMALKYEERKSHRANSANCPSHCKELVEDHVGCVLLCPDCGYVYEDQRCNPENPVCTMGKFGEHADVPRRRSGGYKPPNHFAEIVGHFQGTRSSTAPPEIIERVKDFCFRYKYEPREISPAVVRFFLRRMQQEENNRHENALARNPRDRLRRFTDFYRSAPEMAYRLSGIPPPYMSPMQEDRVTALFPLVIAAYKTSPRYLRRMQDRTDCIKKFPNNPNYSLVFYKECQLLGYDEFLQFIPLPKSTDNIDDNDTMAWKHICDVNGWQYIPTR
jgi:rubrerythrin